jgi:predicted nuclease of predicted toxin-antitoxin system
VQDLKFLADVNIEKRIVDFLRGQGYDVLWIPDYNCHLDDASLLKMAFDEHRIIVTNDKDFGELNFLQRKPSAGIILFRIDEQNVRIKITILKNMLLRYPEKFSNHFVVIARNRIRFKPLEKVS